MTEYFTTEKASDYLTNVLGLPVTKMTLQIYKCRGIAPESQMFGRRVIYTKEALDKWAQSRISPKPDNLVGHKEEQ